MKRKVGTIITLAAVIISLGGCVSSTVTGSVKRNAARCDGFVNKIANGTSTREQEQSFIKANRAAWHSMNYYLNDEPLPEDLKHLGGDE